MEDPPPLEPEQSAGWQAVQAAPGWEQQILSALQDWEHLQGLSSGQHPRLHLLLHLHPHAR